MILAAIDIGSNAARLLITEVIQKEDGTTAFNKLNLVRVPLRLGMDVFETNTIGKERMGMFFQTMKAYQHLMNVYRVTHVKAAATSAMRDASNSADIIKKVRLETGISIEILSGDTEANMIYENHISQSMDKNAAYLYIDVGGGSTELTFFDDQGMNYRESFNIGTLRILKDQVLPDQWDEIKEKLKLNVKSRAPLIAVGTGGNINKVFSMSKKKDGKTLSITLLQEYLREFGSLTLAQRMQQYSLREDRADVIVPALQIYTSVMRWAGIEEILVPKIGLADGLIRKLYTDVRSGANATFTR